MNNKEAIFSFQQTLHVYRLLKERLESSLMRFEARMVKVGLVE